MTAPSRARMATPALALLLPISFSATGALAHDHHGGESKIPEGETISLDPIVRGLTIWGDAMAVQEYLHKTGQDSTLWIHIFIQMFAYGVVFPIGMVFGVRCVPKINLPVIHNSNEQPQLQLTKSRWHVPTQIFGAALAVVGFFLGHAHGGREFVGNNIHAIFAHILQILLIVQVVLGLYLKGHWERGVNGFIRKLIRPCHSVIGKAMPLLAWTQMVFGGITTLGFCQGEHVGQCAAHFIMGSAFVAYGIILTIILLVGQVWITNTGRSQEFYDSTVIAAWGCVNTFTEHRWGTPWVKNDWQHTTMGIIWWCAGLAGVWMSRDRDGNPKRNFIPGFVIFITGWAMSSHPQELMVSEATHSMFGHTLMATGVTRIIEVAFVLKDKQSLDESGRSWSSFQFIPVYVSSIIMNVKSSSPANICAAPLRRRIPLHGRHRGADGPGSQLLHGPRRVHPHPLLPRCHRLSLHQHADPPVRPPREPADEHQRPVGQWVHGAERPAHGGRACA